MKLYHNISLHCYINEEDVGNMKSKIYIYIYIKR